MDTVPQLLIVTEAANLLVLQFVSSVFSVGESGLSICWTSLQPLSWFWSTAHSCQKVVNYIRSFGTHSAVPILLLIIVLSKYFMCLRKLMYICGQGRSRKRKDGRQEGGRRKGKGRKRGGFYFNELVFPVDEN